MAPGLHIHRTRNTDHEFGSFPPFVAWDFLRSTRFHENTAGGNRGDSCAGPPGTLSPRGIVPLGADPRSTAVTSVSLFKDLVKNSSGEPWPDSPRYFNSSGYLGANDDRYRGILRWTSTTPGRSSCQPFATVSLRNWCFFFVETATQFQGSC